MKIGTITLIQIALLLLSITFFTVHEIFFKHDFLLHLAAIPLEVFVAIFVVGAYLEREKNKQYDYVSRKYRELLFRVELNDLLYHCLNISKNPKIVFDKLLLLDETVLQEIIDVIRSDRFRIEINKKNFESFVRSFMEAETCLRRLAENPMLMQHPQLYATIVNLLHASHEIKLLCKKYENKSVLRHIKNNSVFRKMIESSVKNFLEFFFKYLLTEKGVSREIKLKILREVLELKDYY